ncbi:hypothetical protein COK01_26980 [Priestia megaterium]|nr:hypothetical protein COK01_26980 [Priestia megaterium]
METSIGILAITWGIFVLYSSLFKMKKRDYQNQGPVGVSGYFEFEFLFRLLSKSPWRIIKGLTILIGLFFVTMGTTIIM